jgi:hypothetical protein
MSSSISRGRSAGEIRLAIVDMGKKRLALMGILVATALLLTMATRQAFHGLTLVIRAAELHGMVRHLADLDSARTQERPVEIPLRAGSIGGRLYACRDSICCIC